MRYSGIGAFLFVAAASCLCGQQPKRISGEYIEDRSNRVFGCYCEWSGERVTGGREVILGWRVGEGAFRGVTLAGVKMAAVVIGEASLSAGNAPRKSLLFLDSEATPTQREAAEAMLRQQFGGLLGRILSTNATAIDFHREAGRAFLRIGDLLNLEMRKANPPRDALQGAIRWYEPFVPLSEETLGMTLNTRYQGDEFDQHWDLNETGISGYFGTFTLQVP